LDLIKKLDLVDYIVRITEIYNEYISKYQVLLRGSAGSSLLLYYLGINKIDPVQYSIPVSRFINLKRNSFPDIDFDLPSSIRNDLIDTILKATTDTVRITSNYKQEDNKYFELLIREDPTLNIPHNSGIVIYSPSQIELVKSNLILPNQMRLTKDDIGEFGFKKIDLLSNTALEQLYSISSKPIEEYDLDEPMIWKFISEDNGIGITFAETPSIQYVIHVLKPSNIEELSLCLALIRPLASNNIKNDMDFEYLKKQIIYDDDFIEFIHSKFGLELDEADEIRRLFKNKSNPSAMLEFEMKVDKNDNLNDLEKSKLKYTLNNLSKYGFCKAHSINYARMIYCLYWNKFKEPKKFWKSTIKSVKGYYRDWVYIRKGLDYGLKFKGIEDCSPFYHLIYTGYWLKKDFVSRCYLRKIETNMENIRKIETNMENITKSEIKLVKDKITNSVVEKDDDDEDVEKDDDDEDVEKDDDDEDVEKDEDELILGQSVELTDIDIETDMDVETNMDVERDIETNPKFNLSRTEYEFRGIIAGIGGTYTKYNKYQMVITLGYDNNKFINIHLNKKRDLSRFKQIIGKGYWIDGPSPYIVVSKMFLM
jgi:hypothetical protein